MHRFATCLLLSSLVAAPIGAQTLADPRPADPAATRPAADGPLITDIRTIDPETFHAIALRIPDGQTPKIDGHLDDPAWALAPVQGRFIQREPQFGWASTERTEFRILYDDKKIYFGVWAYDREPDGIRASEMKRDSMLRKGDQVKFTIDTFHDHRNAFYFSTNPLGALKDANSVEDGRTINYDWNAVWECRTSRDGQGWYVEIAIPLGQLRFKGGPGDAVWGLNVCRIIIRKNEETYWVPFAREWASSGFARMSGAGVLLGMKDLTPRRRMELVPYVSPTVSRDYATETAAQADTGYGFDARVGLTSSLNADVTYKTDFAQVEADQEVVNLTRFSLFFPEKRQFFTEGAGIFDYGKTNSGGGAEGGPGLLSIYYSRRIGLYDGQEVPILAGGRVTGRVGPTTIGALNLETDQATVRPGDTPVDVPRANYTVLRVKRDVLSKSSIGAIFLNRQGGPGLDFNRSAGVDALFAFGQYLDFGLLAARTFTPGTSGRDWAGAFDFGWKTDTVDVSGTYLDIAERFNAEMGFIPRIDIRNPKGRAAWTPRPKWKGVRQLTLAAGADYFENHAGRIESRNQAVDFSISRQDSSSISFNVDRDYDYVPYDWSTGGGVIPIGGYTWNTVRAGFSSNQSKRVYGSLSYATGGYYSGEKQTAQAGLNFLPLETLLVETSYTRNHVTLPERPTYITNTLSTRVSYSFTPDLFLKSYIQYNDANRTASLNLLFWYIYRPGSDFYIVYDQGWDTELPGPHAVQTRAKSLAIKMTYWISR
jgi:hypothetical protein